jgi:signal transduction histidine kinase
MDSIVSQMLRLAGPAKPAFEPIHLHGVLDHALHLVQHQLDAKKLRARRELHARADKIHGDDHQLEQAFLNLFFNAIEAMSSGGELTVATENTADLRSIRVDVSDTGTGIAPKHTARLFEAFFTTKKHGTGLGLPITRRIIQEHKGTIAVDSELKKGTTFQVTLPI